MLETVIVAFVGIATLALLLGAIGLVDGDLAASAVNFVVAIFSALCALLLNRQRRK